MTVRLQNRCRQPGLAGDGEVVDRTDGSSVQRQFPLDGTCAVAEQDFRTRQRRLLGGGRQLQGASQRPGPFGHQTVRQRY